MKKIIITYIGKQSRQIVQGIGTIKKGGTIEVYMNSENENIINSLNRDKYFKVEYPPDKLKVLPDEKLEKRGDEPKLVDKEEKQKKKGGDK